MLLVCFLVFFFHNTMSACKVFCIYTIPNIIRWASGPRCGEITVIQFLVIYINICIYIYTKHIKYIYIYIYIHMKSNLNAHQLN